MLTVSALEVRRGPTPVIPALSAQFGTGITALVGANGAGKTTLLRVLAGIAAPHRGVVAWGGLRPYDDAASLRSYLHRVGWVPQECPLPRSFTTERLLRHAAWLQCVSPDLVDERVATCSTATRVEPFLHRPLGRLSGGERQRVLLATALVNEPDVIVLDEPTAGLDPGQRESFHQVLRSVSGQATVILSTHLMEDVHLCADRVLGISEGHLVLDVALANDTARAAGFESLRSQLLPLFAGARGERAR